MVHPAWLWPSRAPFFFFTDLAGRSKDFFPPVCSGLVHRSRSIVLSEGGVSFTLYVSPTCLLFAPVEWHYFYFGPSCVIHIGLHSVSSYYSVYVILRRLLITAIYFRNFDRVLVCYCLVRCLLIFLHGSCVNRPLRKGNTLPL